MSNRSLTTLSARITLTFGIPLAFGGLGCSAQGHLGPRAEEMADAGVEACNGRDDDMDGEVDEADPNAGRPCGSAVGVCSIGVLVCIDGELACNGAMGALEGCNAVDDDCDGIVDEEVLTVFYRDVDRDGFGDGEHVCEACDLEQCPGDDGPWVAAAGDCDDTCDTCFIGVDEVCDGLDNDCDGSVDEGVETMAYADNDADSFGAGEGTLVCLDENSSPPPGFVLRAGDCADEDARANPDATLMFTTRIRGVLDEAVDFDFDCDGREERLHLPCPSCQNGACWQQFPEPPRDGDPECGTIGRAQRSDEIEPLGRPALCVRGEAYEDIEVACR